MDAASGLALVPWPEEKPFPALGSSLNAGELGTAIVKEQRTKADNQIRDQNNRLVCITTTRHIVVKFYQPIEP